MLGLILIALGLILICYAIGDAPAPQADLTVTQYTGPIYSRWGGIVGTLEPGEVRYV